MYELVTFDVTSDTVVGMGVRVYKDHPQQGDWIETDDADGRGTMFEVVKVAHSDEGSGSDLYVKKIGFTLDAVRTLCEPKQITADMDPEEASRIYRELIKQSSNKQK